MALNKIKKVDLLIYYEDYPLTTNKNVKGNIVYFPRSVFPNNMWINSTLTICWYISSYHHAPIGSNKNTPARFSFQPQLILGSFSLWNYSYSIQAMFAHRWILPRVTLIFPSSVYGEIISWTRGLFLKTLISKFLWMG